MVAKRTVTSDATESPLYVRAVERAMRVLQAFDGNRDQMSLSELAEATGLDVSAMQRFTHTLTSLGFLRRDEGRKTYALAPRLLDFAHHYIASSPLLTRAVPYMQQLAQETEEATNLTILDGTDVVFVLRFVSRNVLHTNFIVGTRMPAYCTAPGLAMLAALPEVDAEAILARSSLVRHTPHTVIDIRAIRRRLLGIREQGYAHTFEEYLIGDVSTAAVAKDPGERKLVAINVALSTARWQGAKDERRYANLVIAAASAISARST